MKKLFSIVCMITLLCSCMVTVSNAAENSVSYNFSGYTGDENYSLSSLISYGGTWGSYQISSGKVGPTDVATDRGTSVNLVHKAGMTENQYAAVRPYCAQKINTAAEIKVSVQLKDITRPRAIRLNNKVVLALFNGSALSVMGSSVSINAEANKWYDFNLRVNFVTGYYIYNVTCDGTTVKKGGTHEGIISMNTLEYLEIMYYGRNSVDSENNTWIDDISIREIDPNPEMNEFFDFENYTGNPSSLTVMPSAGEWGRWTLNNCTETGNPNRDGVVSYTTPEKGTCLMLRRKYTKYPGLYYGFNDVSYDVTGTVHVSFSWMITGKISLCSRIFRFRNARNSTPYDIISFANDSTIKLLGEKVRNNGVTVEYEANKWYDIDVVYDVPTGFCTATVKNDTETYTRSAYSGYKNKLIAIDLILFETTGSDPQGEECGLCLDDLLIETTDTHYVANTIYDFSDFTALDDGSRPPKGFMLTNFLSKSNNSKEYAGVFAVNDSRGKSLALAMNFPKNLTVHGEFNSSITGSFMFDTALKLNSTDADVNILLSDNTVKENAIKIEKDTGKLYIFGKYSGFYIKPYLWYDISLSCDPYSHNYKLILTHDAQTSERYLKITSSHLKGASKFILNLDNYERKSGDCAEVLFDDIYLSAVKSFDVPSNEANETEHLISEPIFFGEQNGIYSRIDSIVSGDIFASFNWK